MDPLLDQHDARSCLLEYISLVPRPGMVSKGVSKKKPVWVVVLTTGPELTVKHVPG